MLSLAAKFARALDAAPGTCAPELILYLHPGGHVFNAEWLRDAYC